MDKKTAALVCFMLAALALSLIAVALQYGNNQSLQSQASSDKLTITDFENTIQNLDAQLQNASATLLNLNATQTADQQIIAGYQKQIANFTDQIATLSQKVNSATQLTANQQAQIENLTSQLQNATQQIANLTAKLANQTDITVQGLDYPLSPGSNITLTLTIGQITNLFTWEANVTFDPTMLNCTAATYPTNNILASQANVLPNPIIDNQNGSVLTGGTLLGTESFNGSGTLCQIQFTTTGTGATTINLQEPFTCLLDTNLNTINANITMTITTNQQ